MRQNGQPFAQQRVDLVFPEAVADLLQGRRSSTAANPLSNAVNPIPDLAACRLAHSLPLMHSLAL